MIPTGRTYTSTLSGWVWRPVHCEKCGGDYAYKQQIVAKGQGYSPLFLNNSGARSSAQNKARDNFDHKAKTMISAINCPDCGHLQKNMVSLLKNQRFQLLIGPAIALAIVLFFRYWPAPDGFDTILLFFAGAIVLIDGVMMIAYGGILQSLYVFFVLLTIAAWGFEIKGYTLLMVTVIPLGVIALMLDGIFALGYDPLKNSWKPSTKKRHQAPVLRRAEIEAAAAQQRARSQT